MLFKRQNCLVKLFVADVFSGIARLCCDARRSVRSQALTYLQRALLMHDLQTLTAAEWENCFNKVRVHGNCIIFIAALNLFMLKS